MRASLWALGTSAAVIAGLVGCSNGPDGAVGGEDIFQLAVDEAPGGALLSAWVAPDSDVAFLAGGYVGAAASEVPDAMLGRLVRYDHGAFVTVCRTPEVLWWVDGGLDGIVAAGADGIVLRYRADRGCEVSYVDGDWPTGRPTIWGLVATSASDIRFVGGSVDPAGPRAVILHWDGASYTRETVPPSVADVNLFKIARAGDRAYVVGDDATILERVDGTNEWQIVPAPMLGGDATLFTVSCARPGNVCVAVGGRSGGSIVQRDGTSWRRNDELALLPGLSGVYVENDESVYVVGERGETLHYNGRGFYEPPEMITTRSLHGVAGNGSLFIAVGGELTNATGDQRGTILVRGAGLGRYTLDGQTFHATGAPRPELGNARGQ